MINIMIAAVMAFPFLAGGQDQEAKNAVKEFTSVYNRKTSTDEQRIGAIKRLAETPHKRTGTVLKKLLCSHYTKVPVSHKRAAAFALGSFSKVKRSSLFAVIALTSRNNLKNTKLRIALVYTIGSLGQRHTEVLRVLHKLAISDDFCVAKAAIEVIPSFKNRGSVKLLIDYLKKCERKPSNVKVGLKFPRQPKKPGTGEVDPTEDRRDIDLKVTADEKQKLRHDLCYPALKTALRGMTGQSFPDWKRWNHWWRRGGIYTKYSR